MFFHHPCFSDTSSIFLLFHVHLPSAEIFTHTEVPPPKRNSAGAAPPAVDWAVSPPVGAYQAKKNSSNWMMFDDFNPINEGQGISLFET